MKRGFTLLELLVVLAVIAILAAILLPVFAKAQEKARQVSCQSNLKQLALAMLMYVQDYDECFPPSWGAVHGSAWNAYEAWPAMLYPYVKNAGIFDCPTSPDKVSVYQVTAPRHGYDGNYGINYDGLTYSIRSQLASLNQPAEVYMLFDSGDMGVCWGSNTWARLMEDLDLDWNSGKEGANRHNGQVNVAFCDGHVKSLELRAFVHRNADGTPPWIMNWADQPPVHDGSIPYPDR